MKKVSITHTSYLQNETDDLKFYRFKPITKLGVLLNDINLTDDLKLEQVDYLDLRRKLHNRVNRNICELI